MNPLQASPILPLPSKNDNSACSCVFGVGPDAGQHTMQKKNCHSQLSCVVVVAANFNLNCVLVRCTYCVQSTETTVKLWLVLQAVVILCFAMAWTWCAFALHWSAQTARTDSIHKYYCACVQQCTCGPYVLSTEYGQWCSTFSACQPNRSCVVWPSQAQDGVCL